MITQTTAEDRANFILCVGLISMLSLPVGATSTFLVCTQGCVAIVPLGRGIAISPLTVLGATTAR